VRTIDRDIGAIAVIAIERVAKGHRTAVTRDPPAVRARALDFERNSIRPLGFNIVEVLGEVMDRVAAGRGPAHDHFERRVAEVTKQHFDPGLVVRSLIERKTVLDRLCLAGL
jgi:hypothetical protein